MESNETQITVSESQGEAGNAINTQIQNVLQRLKTEALTALRATGAIALWVVGAIIGAIAWWLITIFTGYQFALIAVGIGIIVGYAMKLVLKNRSSVILGLIAGIIALSGLLLGNFLLWGSVDPDYLRTYYYESGQQIAGLSDDQILDKYFEESSFLEYLGKDLSPFSIFVYGLAIYVGTNTIYNWKEELRRKKGEI